MSIEFVDADAEPTPSPEDLAPAVPVVRARRGRLLAAAAAVAAVLVGVALLVPLYAVDRTAFVVDFESTSTQVARVHYDAFGDSERVPITPSPARDVVPGTGVYNSVLTVSLGHGVSYGPWWLALGGVLLVVAVGAAVRPRARGSAAVVTALGGALLGSVGAAWLAIRRTSDDSVPQIRLEAHPDVGLWLLVAAGGLAVVAGLLAATRPPWRRLLPRPRA